MPQSDGYTQNELDDAQAHFGLTFPPDLISLLSGERAPVAGAYDWTHDRAAISAAMNGPFAGLLFDVEHNDLWWPVWGERPAVAADREDILRKAVCAAPRLIPIAGHCYLPATPSEADNPVFSVMQSDIICYGADILDYVERENGPGRFRPWPAIVKHIPFWSDFVELGMAPSGPLN